MKVKQLKVVSVSDYVRKKDGAQMYVITLISEDGVVRAFRPASETPKVGDMYDAILKYNPYEYSYYITYAPHN